MHVPSLAPSASYEIKCFHGSSVLDGEVVATSAQMLEQDEYSKMIELQLAHMFNEIAQYSDDPAGSRGGRSDYVVVVCTFGVGHSCAV